MHEMARDAKVGSAEALRRSMLALIDKGNVRDTHPAIGRRSLWSVKGRGDRKVLRYVRRLPRVFLPEFSQTMNRRFRPGAQLAP